jgi:hypothetical protein
MGPCWLNVIHHILQISMKHITDPILLQIFTMIRTKQPTQNEIDNVLSSYYISKTKLLSHIECNTIILCSHREDVNKYNDLLIQKKIFDIEIFDVTMDTNATNIEHVENWLHDSKFDHIKYIAIGVILMITKNIDISQGVVNGAFVIET